MMINVPFLLAVSNATAFYSVLYLIIIGAAMYFVMIRPYRKRQNEQNKIMSSVASGDSILTTSGFYGVVIDVMDEIVIVEFGNNKNCRIPMKKEAIVEIEKGSAEK